MPNSDTLTRTMPELRKVILAEMKRQGVTKYRLVQMLKGTRDKGEDVPSMTVYTFLQGKSEMKSGDIGRILDALQFELKPTAKAKR